MVVFVDHEQHRPTATAPTATGLPFHLSGARSKAMFLKHPISPLLMKPTPLDGRQASRGSNGGVRDKGGYQKEGEGQRQQPQPRPLSPAAREDAAKEQRANPNMNGFSAALSCYPVVVQIARSVDLNTLDSLSMTCRQFRANLLPFRSQLIRETLHCRNEPLDDPARSRREGCSGGGGTMLTTGKIGRCARDMVSECQRCAGVICRNCTAKPIGAAMSKNRFRRLCSTCLAAPLSDHLLPYLPTTHHDHDHDHDHDHSHNHTTDHPPAHSPQPSFTDPAFSRTPCTCEDSMWLCRPCGQTLRADDTTYKRVWTWRTRYSAYLGGGLGTGIGEGCQGVKCGRGERCLAAEEIEVEVDCEVDDWEQEDAEMGGAVYQQQHHQQQQHNNHNTAPGQGYGSGGHGVLVGSQLDPVHVESHGDEEPGYLRQEIVGVGGVVKQKVKKRVRVGACVEEHEDERESAGFLKREYLGEVRCWCGWCERVVPGVGERG
ncbi:hypothetical protein FQN53_004159 [Emmonsiellopsis sp. PD_33]|nr:hypothetical protein FQN53_004159 [Emmonsiellopsis sp. PD_33]